MIHPRLFEKIDRKNDPHTVAKDVLNSLNHRAFIRAVNSWLQGIGFGGDGGACDFPEDDDSFEGVLCYNHLDEEVLLTEKEFYNLLSEAIQRYIELRPDKREELEQIISQSSLR